MSMTTPSIARQLSGTDTFVWPAPPYISTTVSRMKNTGRAAPPGSGHGLAGIELDPFALHRRRRCLHRLACADTRDCPFSKPVPAEVFEKNFLIAAATSATGAPHVRGA